jgi:hypothetical protein
MFISLENSFLAAPALAGCFLVVVNLQVTGFVCVGLDLMLAGPGKCVVAVARLRHFNSPLR